MIAQGTGRSTLAILCCVALAAMTHGGEPDPLEAALSRPAQLDVMRKPLPDVMALLSRRHGVPIVADQPSLQSAGIRIGDIAITAQLKEKPLSEALDEVLRPHKLAWIAWREVVLVTTATAAQERFHEVRVYKLTRPVPVQRRINSITSTVAPESWTNVGGPGEAAPLSPRLMVVRQSPLVHRQIAAKFAGSLAPLRAREPIEPAEPSAMEKKLAAAATIDFRDAPLAGAVRDLASASGLRMSIDRQALKDEGIRADDLRVRLQIGKIRLASGLSLLLEQTDANLAWTADDAGITITTLKAAKGALLRRSYKVSDILPDGGLDVLIRAIQDTIAPADWEEVGGAGVMKPGSGRGTLDISQGQGVHRQLRQLFADLRAAQRSD